MLGEVKKRTVYRRTYMRPLSVKFMAALSVEPSSIEMMATSSVDVTETLFLVPN